MKVYKFSSLSVYKLRSILLALLLITVYVIENHSAVNYHFLMRPILWSGMILLISFLPGKKTMTKGRHMGLVKSWAVFLATINVAILVIVGLIDGFGRSPYDHSLRGITYNLMFIIPILVARELIRTRIINYTSSKKNYGLPIIVTSLLMTITAIPLFRYLSIQNLESGVQFFGQYFVPEFSRNIVASYLAFFGGPLASIIYMGIFEGLHWISPILPNLRWITIAFVGTACPIFSLLFFQNLYAKETKQIKKKHESKESVMAWMITSILCIVILWFAVGVFPIYPSVIATGSMQPMINPGDLILVEKITDIEGILSLEEGDVIQFKRDDIFITHRIEEIVYDDKGLRFKTKGDNNSTFDSQLVEPEQIRGKTIKVIPKAGWATLLLKQNYDAPMEGIEF